MLYLYILTAIQGVLIAYLVIRYVELVSIMKDIALLQPVLAKRIKQIEIKIEALELIADAQNKHNKIGDAL